MEATYTALAVAFWLLLAGMAIGSRASEDRSNDLDDRA